jgi:hypothetical protein
MGTWLAFSQSGCAFILTDYDDVVVRNSTGFDNPTTIENPLPSVRGFAEFFQLSTHKRNS